jgi:cell division protease FtsH
MDQLHLLAKALIKYETLDTTDIDRVMEGKKPILIKEEEERPSSKKDTPPQEPDSKVDVGDDSEKKTSGDEAGQAS